MKKIKVFISSTFKDLENFRIEVDTVIRMLQGDSIYMEHSLSNHRDALENCLKEVDSCDIFVGIYAFRYGYIPSSQQKSITELEYERASKKGKNLIFYWADESLMQNAEYKANYVTNDADELRKLNNFKNKITSKHTSKPFTNKQELGKLVAIEVAKYYFKLSRGESPNNPLSNYPLPDDICYPNFEDSPYVGLRYFEEQDARVFFGRNQLVFDLIESLSSNSPFLFFYGATGVGKSSVLNAGLIPRLRQLGWEIDSFRRTKSKGVNVQFDEKVVELSKTDIKSILIIDQLEEIWTNPNDEIPLEAIDFFERLRKLKLKNLKVVLSFREEFLAKILNECKEIRNTENEIVRKKLFYSEKRVNPMNHAEIMDAVIQVQSDEEIKKRFKINIEEELPHEIAFDLKRDNQSHIAPLLQITLKKMWVEARKGCLFDDIIFDSTLYRKIKNEGLADFLNEQIQYVGKIYKNEVDSGLVLDILHYFVTKQITANQHSLSEVKQRYTHIDSIEGVVKSLENNYLLFKVGNPSELYRLSHDSLAPLIQELFQNSSLVGQKAARILESKDLSHEADEYFIEAELDSLQNGRTGMRLWNEIEENAISSTQAEVNYRKNQVEEQRKAILRALSNGLSKASEINFEKGSFYVATPLAIIAWEIDRENWIAKEALINCNYVIKTLYDIEDIDLSIYDSFLSIPFYNTNLVELRDYSENKKVLFQGHTLEINSAIFSPDRNYVLTASNDKTARIWDLYGNSITTLNGHDDIVVSAVLSNQGEKILTCSNDHSIRMWNFNGDCLLVINGHDSQVNSVIFSSDNQFILSASMDKTARIWDLHGKCITVLKGHLDSVNSATFSTNNQEVLTISSDNTARLWDINGNCISVLNPSDSFSPRKEISSAIFSPDGDHILITAYDRNAYLFDIKGKKIATLKSHEFEVIKPIFSPDGGRIQKNQHRYLKTIWELNPQKIVSHLNTIISISWIDLMRYNIDSIEKAAGIDRVRELIESTPIQTKLFHYAKYYYEIAHTNQGDVQIYCKKSIRLYNKLIEFWPSKIYKKERKLVMKLMTIS